MDQRRRDRAATGESVAACALRRAPAQWICFDPKANGFGLTASNGLELSFGRLRSEAAWNHEGAGSVVIEAVAFTEGVVAILGDGGAAGRLRVGLVVIHEHLVKIRSILTAAVPAGCAAA